MILYLFIHIRVYIYICTHAHTHTHTHTMMLYKMSSIKMNPNTVIAVAPAVVADAELTAGEWWAVDGAVLWMSTH